MAYNLYDPFSGYSLGNNNEVPTELNKCFCMKNYLSVCGKNNTTYARECELNCARRAKSKKGVCNDQANTENSYMKKGETLEYEPVCGSHRVTYYNKSMISCDSGVSALYAGECTYLL